MHDALNVVSWSEPHARLDDSFPKKKEISEFRLCCSSFPGEQHPLKNVEGGTSIAELRTPIHCAIDAESCRGLRVPDHRHCWFTLDAARLKIFLVGVPDGTGSVRLHRGNTSLAPE